MIDDRQFAHQFSPGDVVRIVGDSGTFLSPFPGRVVFSNVETGKVEVQWPWGAEQCSASEIVKDDSGDLLPPVYDTTYSTWEKARNSAAIVNAYERQTLPLYRLACRNVFRKMSAVESCLDIMNTAGSLYGTDEIRRTVANLMEQGRRLAIYRKDNLRRYKVTQSEKSLGVLFCPRCREKMKPRTHRQGKKVLLCRSCGFCISPKDLVH